jgi:hypothetical protein
VALVAVAGLWILLPREPPPPPLTIRPFTSDPGRETQPALSPDVNQVAFVRAPEGTRNICVKLVDGFREAIRRLVSSVRTDLVSRRANSVRAQVSAWPFSPIVLQDSGV